MTHTLTAALSPAQEQVALSLASGASISSAAASTGVGRTTIYDWMKSEPTFSAAVGQARSEFTLTLRDQLQDASRQALAALIAILDDPTAPHSVRLKAALAILNRPRFPDQGWSLPVPVEPPDRQQAIDSLAQLEADYKRVKFANTVIDQVVQSTLQQRAPNVPNNSEHNLQNPQPPAAAVANRAAGIVPNTSEQQNASSQTPAPVRSNPVHSAKVGRNESCPCGSGRKFKRCCLAKTTAAPGTLPG